MPPIASRSNEAAFYDVLHNEARVSRDSIRNRVPRDIHAGQLCGRPLQAEATRLSSGGEAHVEFLMEEKLSPKTVRRVKVQIPQLSSHIKLALFPSYLSKKMNYNIWDRSSDAQQPH